MYGFEHAFNIPERDIPKVFRIRGKYAHIRWWRPEYYQAMFRNLEAEEGPPKSFLDKAGCVALGLFFAVKHNRRWR